MPLAGECRERERETVRRLPNVGITHLEVRQVKGTRFGGLPTAVVGSRGRKNVDRLIIDHYLYFSLVYSDSTTVL